MNRRISATLELQRDRICCRSCGEALAPAGTSWKPHAALSELPVASLPGAPSATHAEILFRRFSCPKCGSLLDSETALPADPFLDDVIDA
jgi:acetone carboxylase gamma subunit